MDQPTHIIDPEGEVIIVLLNANSHFAEPSEEMVANGLRYPFPEPNNDIQSTGEKINDFEEWGMTRPTFRGKWKKKRYNNVRASLEPISPPI
jgi:hypothetical protein